MLEISVRETEKREELRKYRDDIAGYLPPHYDYSVSDDPIVMELNGRYGKNKESMTRTNNILEVAQKIEYVSHPKIGLVSPENAERLRVITTALKEITVPNRQQDEVSGESLVNAETGDRLDREYRTEEDMKFVEENIKNAINILDQELSN